MKYDVIIVGAGSAGYSCALRLTLKGKHVLLIEKSKLGGTCLHLGCIPTKYLLSVSKKITNIRELQNDGIYCSLNRIDLGEILLEKNKVIDKLYKGLTYTLNKRKNLDIVQAYGYIQDNHTVIADDKTYHADSIVISTGSIPINPYENIHKKILTTDSIFNISEIPNKILIIGGGVIGIEFASIFKGLGSNVTINELSSSILSSNDNSTSEYMHKILVRNGIKINVSSRIESIKEYNNLLKVIGKQKGTDLTSENIYDSILVCIGRKANIPMIKDLKLSSKKNIYVDENFQTSIENIYAIGDTIDTPQLAHVAYREGELLAEKLINKSNNEKINYINVPMCIYSIPEVSSVGYTEKEAKRKFGDENLIIKHINSDMLNARSMINRNNNNIKIIIHKNDNVIVGMHIVGNTASEMIYGPSILINWNADLDDLSSIIHAHPTEYEIFDEISNSILGTPRHGI